MFANTPFAWRYHLNNLTALTFLASFGLNWLPFLIDTPHLNPGKPSDHADNTPAPEHLFVYCVLFFSAFAMPILLEVLANGSVPRLLPRRREILLRCGTLACIVGPLYALGLTVWQVWATPIIAVAALLLSWYIHHCGEKAKTSRRGKPPEMP